MSRPEPELATTFPRGVDVVCVVKRIDPGGVFVRIEGAPHVRGMIRNADWAVEGAAGATPPAAIGQRLVAQVIGHSDLLVHLARRRALADPFPAFRQRHQLGDLVVGRVEVLMSGEAGVRLELPGGVAGYLPRSEIPAAGLRQEGLGLLELDEVAASIHKFGDQEVIVSVKEHIRQRDATARSRDDRGALLFHPGVGPVLKDLAITHRLREITPLAAPPQVRREITDVLVIEDHEGVAAGLALALSYLGFHCEVAPTVDAGVAELAANHYDLLIFDVNMPGKKGFEVLRAIPRERRPRFVIALTGAAQTDWAPLVAHDPGILDGYYQKPIAAERMFARLAALIDGDEPPPDDREQSAGMPVEDLTKVAPSLPGAPQAESRQREEIATQLAALARDTGASHAFVLSYKPGPAFALIAGSFLPLSHQVEQNLDRSPVGDVIRLRTVVIASDVQRQQQRFRYLLALLPLQSFAGCPLPYRDQAQYGLFLTSDAPRAFEHLSEERLRTAAATIGNAIAEERFDSVLTENQNLLLTGFLADSLLHEVKNEAQGLRLFAGTQHALINRYATDLGAMTPEEVLALKEAALGVHKVSEQLEGLIALFRNLVGPPVVEEVDLNRAVERLLATVKPLAEDRSVLLESAPAPAMPLLTLSPRLLDQSLLNVMINAIEQMSLAGGARRQLSIATDYRRDDPFPVRIHVSDTGPGIHFVHQERIFDLFFTTKERGTGLGLYISRFFIERLGGRLTLARSFLFTGSEFLVALPREVVA
jgi:signal transduction histidine kinase/DNA-binding response OmpR family regulator